MDRVGIVAAVAGEIAALGGFILDSQQYADLEAGRFFMRVVFVGTNDAFPGVAEDLRSRLLPIAARFEFDWSLTKADRRTRVLLAVSTTSHCVNHLLHHWSTGALAIEPVAMVSNHEVLKALSEWHDIPFHHVPVSAETRAEGEAALLDLMRDTKAELLVLARYMQVLSPRLVDALAGRCINIHHSFLPGFKGARPYHQAHARGVKLIGATAHFVTAELDDGPIIEQATERVDHRAGPQDLVAIGRDIEAQVLSRAVGWISDRRVFLNGSRTVVFR